MKKLFFLILFILSLNQAEAQTKFFGNLFNTDVSHAREHRKLQNDLSFETWEKKQPKVRIKVTKDAVEQSKETKGTGNKKARLKRKEERIRQRIIKE